MMKIFEKRKLAWGNSVFSLFGVRFFKQSKRRFVLNAVKDAIADPHGIGMLEFKMKNLNVPEKYRHMFHEMGPGDVCIDCGANVGLFADTVLHTGASVRLFEPNGMLVRMLRRKYENEKNAVVHHAAVAAEAGEMVLYNPANSKNDISLTVAGSIVSNDVARRRIGAELSGEKVTVVDLVAYMKSNFPPESATGGNPPVHLLKIDIEGAEFDLLEKMIREKAFTLCKYIVVETHSGMFPDGRERIARLNELVSGGKIDNIFLDWP